MLAPRTPEGVGTPLASEHPALNTKASELTGGSEALGPAFEKIGITEPTIGIFFAYAFELMLGAEKKVRESLDRGRGGTSVVSVKRQLLHGET